MKFGNIELAFFSTTIKICSSGYDDRYTTSISSGTININEVPVKITGGRSDVIRKISKIIDINYSVDLVRTVRNWVEENIKYRFSFNGINKSANIVISSPSEVKDTLMAVIKGESTAQCNKDIVDGVLAELDRYNAHYVGINRPNSVVDIPELPVIN